MRHSAGWLLRRAFRLEDQPRESGMSSVIGSAKFAAETLKAAGLSDPDRRFRLFVKAVQDYAIFILDAPGRIATWNEGAARSEEHTAELQSQSNLVCRLLLGQNTL